MQLKSGKGMAMLEVLIAMVVTGLAILPLVYLQVNTDRSITSAYTKVEYNAAAVSILDMIAADANKKAWAFNLAAGDCDNDRCTGSGDWRKKRTDDILTNILPDTGSTLACITNTDFGSSIKTRVELWWFSAGRGLTKTGNTFDASKSKTDSFQASNCTQLGSLADKLNIDTVTITRIF